MDTNSPRKRTVNENSASQKSKKYFKSLGEREVNGAQKLYYECTICGSNINGNREYNLASHLQHRHRQIYEEIAAPKKDSMPVKRLKLLQDVIEIIAVNGRTFTHILDSGFMSIIHNKLQKLAAAGIGLNLTDPHLPEVKKHLHEMAQKVKNIIKDEVRGRALFILVDVVTKNHRSIFGISIQYIVNGQLKIRSIGMIELLQSHTAIYLADIICARLKLFDIDLKQILTITTDNGANVLKMVREIEAILKHAISTDANTTAEAQSSRDSQCEKNIPIVPAANFDELTDGEIAALLSEVDECTDEAALGILLDDVLLKSHENLLSSVSDQMNQQGLEVLYDITGVNCSAHTFQLAIKSALKNISRKHSNVISLCRHAAKILRLRTSHHEMELHGKVYKSPRLDVETRWCSSYMMV